jgi:F-type H+-transporting ATPase subunit gamma
MSQLILIKRRIKSIKTTKKITHAMRLIAMSLYSKLDKERLSLQQYIEYLQKLFQELSEQCPEWKSKIFLPEEILDSNPLFIVISATKGLCGSLNNNLFKYLEYKLHIEEHQSPTFLTIGKKASAFVNSKNYGTILASYHDLNSNNFPDIAKNIATQIIQAAPAYSSVTVYSTVFNNFFNQKPVTKKVIPFGASEEEEEVKEKEEIVERLEPIWEQNNLEIVDFVANRYINASLTNIMFQALVSEYASRFVAMDGATTNAEKYLETLTLQFNKLRQSLITREVSELSASL